jgi:HSP20 family protein
MNPYEEDRKNEEFIEDFFKKIFESMRKMYINDNLEDGGLDINDDKFGTDRNLMQGFDANIAPHNEINFPEFENDRSMTLEGRRGKFEKNEFSTDIIENDEEISVTVNIPGAEKEDIDLNVTEGSLEIIINTPKVGVEYHKIHKLPCNVKPKATIASYKNGVLDIVMKQKEKKKTEGKYKARID